MSYDKQNLILQVIHTKFMKLAEGSSRSMLFQIQLFASLVVKELKSILSHEEDVEKDRLGSKRSI